MARAFLAVIRDFPGLSEQAEDNFCFVFEQVIYVKRDVPFWEKHGQSF